MKGGIRSIYSPKYDYFIRTPKNVLTFENGKRSFKIINIPKLPVFTAEEGIQSK